MKKINCDFGKEKNGNAKLTHEQVLELRALHQKGGMTERALAAQFGICKTHAHRIINGLSWA
jgi:DNA-binding MarR family transcriptional regulator